MARTSFRYRCGPDDAFCVAPYLLAQAVQEALRVRPDVVIMCCDFPGQRLHWPGPEFPESLMSVFMEKTATILFVDDEKNILGALRRLMRGAPYECLFAETGVEALALLREHPVDVVISDMKMPGMSGEDLLAEVASLYPETVRMVLSGYSEESMIMGAINTGRIWGFIHKPWNDAELKQTIEHAVFTQRVIAERALLVHTVARYKAAYKESFAGFIGKSVAMQFVYNSIEKAAPSKASVFVTGESGTGKELAVRAIHQLSPRADRPFIALNCAAIPGELMESEIFGHVKGAFSGALNARDGAAQLADGGTLFLDELAEMDVKLQSKLLRFIQTGTYQRVGSSAAESADIRFVCATNQDPLKSIAQDKLREDLYYRLNVVSLHLPPLRERERDAVMLAEYFLQRFAKEENKPFVGFASDSEQLISSYEWPGNVRQLENTIHSVVILSQGPLVTAQDLAGVLRLRDEDWQARSNDRLGVPDAIKSVNETPFSQEWGAGVMSLARVEELAIKKALAYCEGNVVKAAAMLEVSPSTLYRKMQSWE